MGSDIKVIEEFNQQIAHEIMQSKTPVLLKGGVSCWPSVVGSNNIFNYLSAFDIGKKVQLLKSQAEHDGRFFYNNTMDGFNFSKISSSVADTFEQMNHSDTQEPNPPLLAVQGTTVEDVFPGFYENNNLAHLGFEFESHPRIWYGNQVTVATHCDHADNIACNVAGRRRFTLFPPEQIRNLYIGPIDFTPAGPPVSLADIRNPDLKQFPLLERALESALTVELQPGDALFIPMLWWHHVESLEPINVLVNFWWGGTAQNNMSPMACLMYGLLTMNDLSQTERDVWQTMFNHYLFSSPEEVSGHIPDQVKGIFGGGESSQKKQVLTWLSKQLAQGQ